MTELCNGTLEDLVVINKDPTLELTSDKLKNVVLRQITNGVKYLHHYKILHRDLKPHNILYYINPLVMKLADFGCSRSLPKDATHYSRSVIGNGYSITFRPFGTDGWLAPEVLSGVTELKPPHAVDIYPLGLIFTFTLCGGRHPYGENNKTREDLIKNKLPMLEDIRQQLIEEHGNKCLDLIKRMLDPNPEKRPTAADVLKDENFPPPLVIERDHEVCYTKRCNL